MPLHIDGKEVIIGEFGMNQFDKADVDYAFHSLGSEKIVFTKKGSELKAILHDKKRQLEDNKALLQGKMAVLKEELGERKSGTKEGNVDNIENNISYELTDDSVANATEEEKLAISAFKKCAYQCAMVCKDLKTVDTMLKHLDDAKSYKLNLQQMNAIEKAEQYFEKASDEAQAKVEKVMSEFKEGKLKDAQGNRVSDRKQAIAIAMSEAGIEKSDFEKFYPTGQPTQHANNAEATDTLTKKREMEKSDEVSKAFDDLFEKATYKNNAQNRKLGRVGRQYGGKKDVEAQGKARGQRVDTDAINSIAEEMGDYVGRVSDGETKTDIPHFVEVLRKEKTTAFRMKEAVKEIESMEGYGYKSGDGFDKLLQKVKTHLKGKQAEARGNRKDSKEKQAEARSYRTGAKPVEHDDVPKDPKNNVQVWRNANGKYGIDVTIQGQKWSGSKVDRTFDSAESARKYADKHFIGKYSLDMMPNVDDINQ